MQFLLRRQTKKITKHKIMNGASLCNSVLLHSHSISRLNSPCSFICSYSFTTSRYISISHRIRQSFRAVADKRSDVFHSFALKNSTSGNSRRLELEDDVEEEDDEDWGEFDEEVEGDEDEEDEGEFLPMDKMKKWLERRPRGFGLGKKYETSIEDKLLDEIQQSWKAQAANLNKLKNDPLKSQQLKRDDNLTKGPGEAQTGFRVRVTNLPRKKNVHRDLKVAFKEVSGILSITPAVSGNKKTKDPVCKGFAFVDFKTETDANRFVEQFSGQRLAFGKVIKQIKCQVVEFSSDESVSKEVYLDNGFKLPKLPYSGREADSITDVVQEDAFLSSGEESDDSEEEIEETEVEEVEQNHISSSIESPPIELRLDSKTKLKSEKQVVKREIIEPEELEPPLVSFQGNKFEEAVGETLLDDEQSEEVVAETLLDDELDGDNVEEDFEENLELMSSSLSSSEENAVDRIRMLEQKLLDKEKLLNGGAGLYKPEAKSAGVEGNKKEKKKKKKKILVKGQAKKSSKIEIPGSSKRLKVKEKALLTGVLVKYAAKVASTSE